jgi:hypothetical protein
MITRCVEVDAVAAFVELNPLSQIDYRNTESFSMFLVEECSYLSQIAFSTVDMSDLSETLYMLDIARYMSFEKKVFGRSHQL